MIFWIITPDFQKKTWEMYMTSRTCAKSSSTPLDPGLTWVPSHDSFVQDVQGPLWVTAKMGTSRGKMGGSSLWFHQKMLENARKWWKMVENSWKRLENSWNMLENAGLNSDEYWKWPFRKSLIYPSKNRVMFHSYVNVYQRCNSGEIEG